MKRINIILAAVALLLAVACNRKVEFQYETFVTFYDATYSVNEREGTMIIPVNVYNPNGKEVQVTVTGIDGEGDNGAVEGVNYEILSPASGVLVFPDGETTQNIEVALLHDKSLTGTKTFELKINSGTEGVNVGGFNMTTIKILDNEHPLVHLIGEWSGYLLSYFSEGEINTTFNIEAVDDDETYTKLLIDSGLEPMLGMGSGVKYSAVCTDNKTIVVQSEQLIGYESYYITGVTIDATGLLLADDFKFVYQDGALKLTSPYAVIVPGAGQDGNDALAEMYVGGQLVKK